MRAAWLVGILGVTACARGPEPAAPTPPPSAGSATAPAPTAADAAAAVVSPPADAPSPGLSPEELRDREAPPAPPKVSAPTIRTVTVPPALAATTPWVGRRFVTGMIRRDSTLETLTVHRANGQALVTEETKVAGNGMSGGITAWTLASRVQYLGTYAEKGNLVRIDVANGSDVLALTCRHAKLAAAAAGALRDRTPRADECGDTGRWVPSATTKVDVLRCASEGSPRGDEPDVADEYVFAPAPGIEYLYVNDDCSMQGGGWRMIPADGSVAAVRVGDASPAPPSSKRPGSKKR